MADTNRAKVSIVEADQSGTAIAGAQPVRVRTTNESLQWSKTVTPSTEIQPNRNVQDIVDIGAQGGGTLAFELHTPRSNSDSALFLGMLMCAAWTAVQTVNLGGIGATMAADGSVTIAVSGFAAGQVICVSGDNGPFGGPWVVETSADGSTLAKRPASYVPTYTVMARTGYAYGTGVIAERAGGPSANPVSITISGTGYIVDLGAAPAGLGIRSGDWIALFNTANAGNAGFYHCTMIAGNTLICDQGPVNAPGEEATAGVTLFVGSSIRNDIVRRYSNISATIYNDANTPFTKNYGAIAVAQTQFSFDTNGITTGTHTMMGMRMAATNDEGLADFRIRDRAMSSRANVVMLNKGTAKLNGMASAKTMTLTVNNNLRAQPGIGSYGLVGIGAGTFEVTGSMSTYFQTPDLYEAFMNNQAIRLSWGIGIDGSYLFFDLPNVVLTADQQAAAGLNQDMVDNCSFQAKECEDGYTMSMNYFPWVGNI